MCWITRDFEISLHRVTCRGDSWRDDVWIEGQLRRRPRFISVGFGFAFFYFGQYREPKSTSGPVR